MPELPEVETIVRDLKPLLCGRAIVSVRCGRKPLRLPWNRQFNRRVCHRRITGIQRRGKWIIVELEPETAPLSLVFHMGMSGQLVVMPANEKVAPHTHLIFTLEGGEEQLRFRDPRRFGGATLIAGDGALAGFFAGKHLGPEPGDIEPGEWAASLGRSRRSLKAALLDQRLVAGVGNIYADESLWEARLHPARPSCTVAPADARTLLRAIRKVLDRAIHAHGSSIRDYISGNGREGNYQQEFRVYARTGLPCPRCKTPIRCIRMAGRSTHYCPRCQDAALERR